MPASSGLDDARHIDLSRHHPEAFGVVFDRYFAEIHGYVARRLGTDVADDVASATFETAFRKRQQYEPDRGSARAWLYGIATNHISRHQRHEVRRYRALARSAVPRLAEGHEDEVAERVTAQAEHSRPPRRWRNFPLATGTSCC
jgi:DNA-directed RNA polymerase specialized sigma24 family protein